MTYLTEALEGVENLLIFYGWQWLDDAYRISRGSTVDDMVRL